MNYTSTRDNSVKVSAAYAIATGISPDGGLYVPEAIPALTHEELLASCPVYQDIYRTQMSEEVS